MGFLADVIHALFKDYWPATLVIGGAILALIARELRLRRRVVEFFGEDGQPKPRQSQPYHGDSGAVQQIKSLNRRLETLEREFGKIRTEFVEIQGEVQDIGTLTARVESVLQKQEVHDREILRLRDRFHTLVNTGEETLHEARMTLEKILTVAEQIKERT